MDIPYLVERARNGDQTAFAELVHHFQRPLFGFLARLGLPSPQIDEIAQEAFLRAWLNLPRFDARQAQFVTWLFTIARNMALDELRRLGPADRWQSDAALDDFEDGSSPPAERLQARRLRDRLRAEIRCLPMLERSLLALAYVRELGTGELARIHGLTESAVKTRLHRARQLLKRRLEDCDER